MSAPNQAGFKNMAKQKAANNPKKTPTGHAPLKTNTRAMDVKIRVPIKGPGRFGVIVYFFIFSFPNVKLSYGERGRTSRVA